MPNNTYLTIVTVAVVALFVWAIVFTIFFLRALKAYKKLTKGITKKDLKTILTKLTDSLKDAGDEIDILQKDLKSLEDKSLSHIQKVGFFRFNPFSDTGGNQSFVICLLDSNDSGIVITSLHSRDQTRIYSKRLKNGKSEGHELSKEEQEAFKLALKRKKIGK